MRKIILFLLVVCCCLPAYAREPKFQTLGGAEVSYQELLSSPKTVLLTWAVWCPYCRREVERIADRCIFLEDVEIFFINLGEPKSLVDKFARNKGFKDCIREKIILDSNSFIAREFKIIGIPTYLFFKDGEFLQKSYFFDKTIVESVFGAE